jgi:hypothetical protein
MTARVVVLSVKNGKSVPVMTTANPEIVEVIQRLISRELYMAAYAKPEKPTSKKKRKARLQI